jgi:hypothetical protein
METEKPGSPLAGIRTLAQDLARSGKAGDTAVASSTPSTPPRPAATIVGTGESRVYQAPTIKKQLPTKKPIIPSVEKDIPVPPPPKKPKEETKLTPLTGPKSAEETMIVVGNEDAGSATIIRDTKRDRFRLFPAIGASLTAWVQGIKERYFTKKVPKYTVPEATRRKGVIQKATSKTGKITTFDNTSLHARIKAREERATPKQPTTTWTANTEPGFALLEAPESAPPTATITNVQVVPRKSFRAEEAPKAEPRPRIIVASETEPILTTPQIEPNPQTEREERPQVTEAPQPIIEETPARVPVNEQDLESRPEPLEPRPTTLRGWLVTLNTNLVALAVVGVVTGIGIFGLTLYSWYSERAANITISTSIDHSPIIDSPLQLLFSPERSAQSLTTTLASNLTSSGPRVLQFAFTTTPTGETLLTPQQVVSGFEFETSAPFTQSLNAIYFGSIAGETPFLLLKTTDRNTAFGGMLNWEATLYDDLRLILRLPDSDSIDQLTFRDLVINGVDARALMSEEGTVYLVYNQPKDNVLIITTSTEAIVELLALIK